MHYWGKVLGAVAGLATGRPWMVLIGVVLGHQFDRGFAERFSRFGADPTNGKLEKLSAQFVQTLFQSMGHLTKVDGRVTEDEIRAARALMHRLGLGPVEIRQAIAWFEAGKRTDYPLKSTLRQLRADSARKANTRMLFVRLLMEVALSKPSLHQKERAVIWSICTELDIGRVELAQLEAMLRAQRGFKRSVAGSVDKQRVDAAYQMLGVQKAATNAEIKKAYRRLMNKNHPDKIMSSKPDQAVISEAERRTREVRGAYEMLKARRSIR